MFDPELIKIALMGTDRMKVSAELSARLQEWDIGEGLQGPERVLTVAALQSRYQRAGYQAMKWEQDLQTPPEKSEKICSAEAGQLLERLLREEEKRLLPEFIAVLAENEQGLPPERLPHLIGLAAQQKEFWQLLKPVIGQRGQWLIRLNPDWHHLQINVDEQQWDTAIAITRQAILQQLRAEGQLERSIHYLESTWATDSPADKTAFLGILSTGLDLSDEAFLEQALDDSRKEVRQAAARLLARLPGSAFNQRMQQRLLDRMNLKKRMLKKEKLEIDINIPPDDVLSRDGIEMKKQWARSGVKASRFLQIVSFVDPFFWEQHLGKTPKQIVEIFVRSDWADILIQGSLEASVLHDRRQWQQVLLDFWVDHYDRPRWENIRPKNLLKKLSDDVLNDLLYQHLKKTVNSPEPEHPLLQLLILEGHHWEEKVILLFIKTLKKWIDNGGSKYFNHWQYRPLLINAAYSSPARLYPYFEKKWPRMDPAWSNWNGEIDEFLRILQLRWRMEKVIRNEEQGANKR